MSDADPNRRDGCAGARPMMPAQAPLAHVRRVLRRAVLGACDLDGALMAGTLAGEITSLPMGPHLSEAQAAAVVAAVRGAAE